ncbi:MAG: gamma-glutamyltransferase family protein [Chloroflexi bacterium]|nr:gamma-glutamyltransferase family protein [Chloroflexota bacterium]MDA1226651.1 gamma-glutamyltransferase family protein [Chloroflexota bacterium]
MTTNGSAPNMEKGDVVRPPTGRPVVYGTQGVISSGHYLTSMAGMQMLQTGGNAFDAVVAACFAAGVTEPMASYSLLAEGVFMFYDSKSGDLLSLSGQGTAPGKATVDFFKSKGHDCVPTGPGADAPLSFTVPGVIAALTSMLERYGTKTVAEVLAPSIRYAEAGFPNYEYMLQRIDNAGIHKQFELFPPGGRDIFYDNGQVPKPGSMLVQKKLAGMLKQMVAAESEANGTRIDGIRAANDIFYRGDIARSMIDFATEVGGVITMEDLDSYQVQYEEPIKATFMGHEISSHSTWTQGIMTLQILNMLESFDLEAMGHNSTEYIHIFLEVSKLVFADREAYYGDPDFVTVPIDGLISKEYAVERAKLVNADKPYTELPAAGDPWKYSSTQKPADASPSGVAGVPEGASGNSGGTTHISCIDRDGNLVCATPSGGALSKGVFFPEQGASMSSRIEMFNFIDGHPNRLEPGKRPRTTLINYIVSKDGQPVMTIGCPGGDHQAQANAQLILNTLVFGMNPQEAVEVPRFATESVPDSFYPHVYYPNRVSLEEGIPESTADALRSKGHGEIVRAATCGMGGTVSKRDPETGVMSTGGDPRRACYAIGW